MTSRRRSRERSLFSARNLRRLLAIDILLLLAAVSLTSMSAAGPAARALGRTAGILTEADAYLDSHFGAIQQEAAQTQETQLTLPDFPLPVSFSPKEVRDANREQFRRLLLARSGALLRDRGAGAFRAEGSGPGFVSPDGPIRVFIDLLRPTPHRALIVATAVLAALAALLALRVAMLTRRFERLSRIGRALLLGAGAFLVLATAVRIVLALATWATGDYATHEFLSLAGELTWAAVRDAAIVSVFSAVMLATGELLARSDRNTLPRSLDSTASTQ